MTEQSLRGFLEADKNETQFTAKLSKSMYKKQTNKKKLLTPAQMHSVFE
jgi:hypothetical protein